MVKNQAVPSTSTGKTQRKVPMEVAIIGAGPIGLYFASLCEESGIDYKIFEADSFIGGQLTHLYPEKIIYNIPGIQETSAASYIAKLSAKLDTSKIILGSKINSIEELKRAYNYVINATGIGECIPRKLGIEGEEKYNVIYYLHDYKFLANKKVVIFGGGNSALDWAHQLSEISQVTLVHRRDEFRGNVETIQGCDLKLFLSYTPESLTENVVTIKSVKTGELTSIEYDYILVNFGQLITKTEFETSENVFCIGDVTGSRTIAEGIIKADEVFNLINL